MELRQLIKKQFKSYVYKHIVIINFLKYKNV